MSNILVIEDDPSICKLAAVNLRARGHLVIEVDTAENALVQWRDHSPALVLLDIRLPGMGGWDLLAVTSADSAMSAAPVIVMTASGMDVEANARRFPNVVDVLIKPFDVHDLIRAVATALAGGEPSHGR
jgi:CheY-like chemotaxis protein